MIPEQKAHELLTTKSDVYSMGVVLLNVLFDWRRIIMSLAHLNKAQQSLYTWVKSNIRERSLVLFIDSYVAGKVTPECFIEIIDIALHCLMKHKDERPSMEDVVKRLKYAFSLQTSHNLNFTDINQLELALQNRLQTSNIRSLGDNDHIRMSRWSLNDDDDDDDDDDDVDGDGADDAAAAAGRMNSWILNHDMQMSIANF